MTDLLYLLLVPALFVICYLYRVLTRRRFKRYPLEDLKSRRVIINMDELCARMDKDHRVPFLVCKEKRDDGPTPCWWPFCNCGE